MPTPHDALFKHTFSQPEHAASLLRSVVPEPLLQKLELSTLELMPGSFVDAELAERHTDLLFSVRLRERSALVYVLLEHQSTEDRLMAFRLLRYLVRIWDAYLARNPGSAGLPAILPVVVFHGEAPWSAPTEFLQLVDLSEEERSAFAGCLPRLSFLLDDLSTLAPEALRGREGTVERLVTEALLSCGRGAERLEDILPDPLEFFLRLLQRPGGPDAVVVFLRYLVRVTEVKPAVLRGFARQLGPPTEEAFMTTAEMLRQEGEARGREKGKAEGRAETLLRQLGLRFGPLSAEIQERVRGADLQALDRWTAAILTASSVEEALR